MYPERQPAGFYPDTAKKALISAAQDHQRRGPCEGNQGNKRKGGEGHNKGYGQRHNPANQCPNGIHGIYREAKTT